MESYTLYHFQFSLFSIMVRYAITLRGDPAIDGQEMVIEQKVVNLHHNEHLSEWYLTEVNHKGQVPAMTSLYLKSPITESLEISYLLAKRYPRLLPDNYESIIKELLQELYAIQPLSLSAPPLEPEEQTMGNINPIIDETLSRDVISSKWREALEVKQKFHDQTLRYALNSDAVNKARAQAREFFGRILIHLSTNIDSDPWILPGPKPTLLDGHCVPFIRRLIEAGNGDLVPLAVQKYSGRATAGQEWQEVMQGKPTLWDVYLRDVLIPEAKKKKEREMTTSV